MNTSNTTIGSFHSPMVRGPAVEVDCSGWDHLGEELTDGSFETNVIRGPAVLQKPSLILEFSIDPTLGASVETVLAKMVPILNFVKGHGFTWQREESSSQPAQVTIVFVAVTDEAAQKLQWLKLQLTPMLVDVREVLRPELIEYTVLKV